MRDPGSGSLSHGTEVEAATIFPGITVPGRSGTPRSDLLAKRSAIPRAIISAKWRVRHDRMNDITNECPVYKDAYERIYRRARGEHLFYYVVTNEYNRARLRKMLADSCLDGVVHVHKPAVVEVSQQDGQLAELMDLVDFLNATSFW